MGQLQAAFDVEERVRFAIREFATAINASFRGSIDMSPVLEVTSSLPLSNLAYWERVIRSEFLLALRSSATPWIMAWAKPNRFLTWVDLCSSDGYVRERTLRTLSGPTPNSFFFSLAARRINDWVPEVRQAAREKLPSLARQSNPEHVVDALCAMLPTWFSWGRMQDEDQQIIADLMCIADVVDALKRRLIATTAGPMSVVLSQAARTDALDNDLVQIAEEAIQPSVRATAHRALLDGRIVWVQSKQWRWTDVRYCKGHFHNVMGERKLRVALPFLEAMERAASDRSCIVRAVAAEALVKAAADLGSAALPIAQRLASDVSPRVADRGAFVLKRLLSTT
ncbi:MAG: hypothetical protein QM749_18715 [Aquabacterium sp.]